MNHLLTFSLMVLFSLSNASQVCYPKYGCFDKSPPFDNSLIPLPQSPSQVGTSFHLFTRRNPINPKIIDDTDVAKLQASGYDGSKETFVIIHGWTEDVDQSKWLQSLRPILLAKGSEDKNVIIVEWKEGAQEFYTNSVANTRLVGAQVAELIRFLNQQTKNTAASFYVIGFSLGAHVAGYAGRRLKHPVKLKRITGLDPAGPFFNNPHPDTRLDHTDADFVDVIHTSEGGAGTTTPSGHVDFYPNSGGKQPGCEISTAGVLSTPCSHGRAHEFFIESINTQCPFRAYPCSGGWDQFTRGDCLTCGNGGCPEMGYNAINSKGKAAGKYYLFTSNESPFSCGVHRIGKVTFYTSSRSWWELDVSGRDPGMRVYGDKGNTGAIRLGKRELKAGSMEKFIAPFKDLGTLTSIDVWMYQDISWGWKLKKVLIDFTDPNEKPSRSCCCANPGSHGRELSLSAKPIVL